MALYTEFETETSYRYLKRLINFLNEPVCLLGGWAVYMTVNENFKREYGRNYLGSRDIDLGFHVDRNLNEDQLKNSALARSLSLLEEDGFKLLGFRYYKEIHYETGEELTPEEAKNTPTYNIFTIYVDPVVDNIHPSFKKMFGFVPVDETLLTFVFKNRRYRRELIKSNKLLWIPSPEILIATKIKSIPDRTKDEKLVKDLCDTYAFGWYSGVALKTLKNSLQNILPSKYLEKSRNCLKEEVFKECGDVLGIDAKVIKNVVYNLLTGPLP